MIKILEFFGGIGAPRKALENLNVDIKSLDYVEILPSAVNAYNSMYNENYEPQDITKWNKNMEVDILIQGSPCLDFSIAGKGDINSGRSILYRKTLDIIENLNPRPKVVIWENVKGLLSKNHIEHFNHYLKAMENLGYKNSYKVLNSLNFSIPQNRERVFVVSIRNNINYEFDFNDLETKPLKPLVDFLEEELNVSNKYDVTQPSMIKALEAGKVKVCLTNTNTITTKQVRWNNAGIVFKKYSNFYTLPRSKDGELINGSYNRVWDSNKYVGTIPVANIPKIGVEQEKHLYFRYLTPRECWRLMGFSDIDFDKVTQNKISKDRLYMLAGNSIVVPVLEAIFKPILKNVFKIDK